VRKPPVTPGALIRLGGVVAFVLWGLEASLGLETFTTAAFLAFMPLPVYLALALWIDRFEPEPRGLLTVAFLWGASVAILLSGLINDVFDLAIGNKLTAVTSGPVTEELLKGIVLFWLYFRKKEEFDGPIDGIIYAAMVGLGFAVVENIDYYGRAFAKGGTGALAIIFTLRGVMGPFCHPLFTSMTGVGLGIAVQTHRRWLKHVAPVFGLALAILLHATWNTGASKGPVFFAVYVFIMVPAMIALLAFALASLRVEGRVIRLYLAAEQGEGILSDADLRDLGSVRGRWHASLSAAVHHGWTAWRRRRAFHLAATELAFLRHRVADGVQPPDPELEAEYVGQLLAYLGAGR
jgi:protease PrsW